MPPSPEKELWALALWVEREHAEEGERFIAERVIHFAQAGDDAATDQWLGVARRQVGLTLVPDGSAN